MTILPRIFLQSHQLGRFAFVGTIVTIIDITLFWLFLRLGIWIIAAHLIAYCLVYPIHFILNRHYTFHQNNQIKINRMALGWTTGLLTLGLSSLTLWGFIQIFPPLEAKIATTGLIFLLNFLINKYFIFKT